MHLAGQTVLPAAAMFLLRLYQGKVLYSRKHHGQPAARLYKLLLLAAALARLALSPRAWVKRPPRRQAHLALAGHYRRLIGALPGM